MFKSLVWLGPEKIPAQVGFKPGTFRSRGGRLNHLPNEAVGRTQSKVWQLGHRTGSRNNMKINKFTICKRRKRKMRGRYRREASTDCWDEIRRQNGEQNTLTRPTHTHTHTHTHTRERDREREGEREGEKERGRERERGRDRETERETERENDRDKRLHQMKKL